MPYNLAQHWTYLQTLLKTYDTKHAGPLIGDADDIAAYKTAREVTEEMVRMGLEIESTSSVLHPGKKISLGKKMDQLNARFGAEEIPSIKGVHSLQFAQEVYLPQLIQSEVIEYSRAVLAMGKTCGIDIDGKKVKSAKLAAMLETNIKKYIEANAALKLDKNNEKSLAVGAECRR